MRNLITSALLCVLFIQLPVSAQTRNHPDSFLIQTDPGQSPVRVDAASVVVEPAAGMVHTTIELVFRNPNVRVLEGHLKFPLRPGQQVTGFALDINGVMREAVPVEKARGRQVFEAIERRNIDPALLEQTEGDFFRLRVYPLPAGGTRRVRVNLLEPIVRTNRGATMTLPLQFAEGLAAVDITVVGHDTPEVEGLVREQGFLPGRDGVHRMQLAGGSFRAARGITLIFPGASGPATQIQAHRGEHFFVTEVPVSTARHARALPSRIGLLWDASTSGEQRSHDLEFALLDAYFRAAGTVDVQLVRMRDIPDAVEQHRVVEGNWASLRAALEATVYDGATNPGGWKPDPGVDEYLLFSDGLFNYGHEDFPAFGATQRLYSVQAGAAGDATRLNAMTAVRRGAAIPLGDSGDLPDAVAALLYELPRVGSVSAIGATDVVVESNHARNGFLRIAGRLTESAARLRLEIVQGDETQTRDVLVTGGTTPGNLAAMSWARYSLIALHADPLRNRAAIAAIGKAFAIVTAETSLLVLDDVADYVRYDIAPPSDLQTEFKRLKSEARDKQHQDRQARIDAIAAEWAERAAWWETPFPKNRPKPALVQDALTPSARAARDRVAAESMSPVAPAPVAPAQDGTTLDTITVTGSRINEESAGQMPASSKVAINLRPWQPDSPYTRRLREAAPERVYALYLDERRRQPQGTAFYLDVADILFEGGQLALALRVLSNLAEMDLDNRHILRVLGYRLMQSEHAALALPVLQRVLSMGEEEPQSYRDLAHAYAAAGNRQKAVDALYQVVTGDWDERFPDIAQIALAELNALLATSSQPLETRTFDRRLLRNLPLALRTVLSWDSDNSDMDLWVTDPNGEKAFYGHKLTYQGGRMSDDFTGGYGPEEFALRTAKPGTYRVEANFYDDRQQLVTGATTLQLWLSTGFGTTRQQDRRITLRLKGQSETILVGEFEVE